jgi:hypothetical protein
MRALLPILTDRNLREEFVLSLTDMHQSNIFVDSEWHIKRIIDLEWACSRPIQTLGPPYWLNSKGIDQIHGDALKEYAKLHEEFMAEFQREELERYKSDTCSQILQSCWERGTFWYLNALDSPSALPTLFLYHIQPQFAEFSTVSDRELMKYWRRDASNFIATKVREGEEYKSCIRQRFQA